MDQEIVMECDCGETWEGEHKSLHYEAVRHSQTCDENYYSIQEAA
jgi:hypothetical protein